MSEQSTEIARSDNWCIRNRNCTVEQAEHVVDCPARRRPYATTPPEETSAR